MPNPFRQDAPRKAPQPGVGSRDLMRLYVMAVVLVLVAAGMVFMYQETLSKPEAEEKKGGVTVRKEAPPGGGQPAPEVPEKPKEKRKIDVDPLPEDGEISFEKLAAPFRDGTEKPVKETREFITLLTAFLNAVTPESLSEKIEKGLTADIAYHEPDKRRGTPLSVYGRLIMIYTERIEATTPDNVEVVYLCAMQEFKTGRTILYYLPEYPLDEKGKRVEFAHYMKRGQRFYTDWVRVEGIFLRQYDYPSQIQTEKGEVWARSALLMAKTMRKAAAPENLGDLRGPFIFIVLSIGVVIAGVVVAAGVISRKYSSGSLRLKMMAVRKAKGEGIFPKPNPEKQVLGDEIPKAPDPGPESDVPKFVDPGDRASSDKPS